MVSEADLKVLDSLYVVAAQAHTNFSMRLTPLTTNADQEYTQALAYLAGVREFEEYPVEWSLEEADRFVGNPTVLARRYYDRRTLPKEAR